MPFGPMELVIILLMLVVVFGAGRLAELGGALGKGIKEFRSATHGDSAPAAPGSTASSAVATPCLACGLTNRVGQSFCGQCGARLGRVA
jgi:sec-independent protein translocase protein TatA